MKWQLHNQYAQESGNRKRTWLIVIISPFLFFAPERHLDQLERINPAMFLFEQSWARFITAREKPWTDFILYVSALVFLATKVKMTFCQATVLLAVNVSYLAVPQISPSSGTPPPSTSSKIAIGAIFSLCSIVASIGCIVVGLLLVNEDRSDPKTSSEVRLDGAFKCDC